jgi:hypothetical protein
MESNLIWLHSAREEGKGIDEHNIRIVCSVCNVIRLATSLKVRI